MLYTIIFLAGLGALIGIYILSLALKSRQPSARATIAHGGFVALVLLILAVYTWPGILLMFLTAALGGIVIIYRDLTASPVPKWLALLHSVVALGGFIFLLVFTFAR